MMAIIITVSFTYNPDFNYHLYVEDSWGQIFTHVFG